ncbi:MAG: response regulator [Oscillochloris sp.]|nr:response regulator [Oscillochloris sp.]
MFYYTIITAGIVCALVASFAWRNRAERGAIAFFVLMIGVMIWVLAYAQELNSSALPAKILWSKIEYVGIVTVPVAWLVFALQYTERQRWSCHWRLGLITIPSLLTLVLVWTNEAHRLIWHSIRLVPSHTFVGWQATYGPGFWLFTTYAYILLLIGTIQLLLVVFRFRKQTLYRGQASALLIGSLLPWIGNLLYNFGINPMPGIELAPFAFTVSGVIFTWALSHLRLFDIVPIARDRVIERMRDGVIVLDTHDRVIDINPAACSIIDWERREVIGRPIMPILGQYAMVVEPFINIDEVDEQISVDVSGEPRVFQVRISPLYERLRKPSGRVVILSDITRLKLVEQELIRARTAAEAANEAKSAFLATMSHEIRTPMNGVLGMADLLQESELSTSQQELVQMIHTSGNQLIQMINTVLDFSKIEAGQLDLDVQPFDLRICIESSLDVVAATAAEKGLELSYRMLPNTPITIGQDQTRLRQILVNLLNNAVKFTQCGEVVLQVHRIDDGPAITDCSKLAFTIRDTGIGIPEDRMDRLFRSFSQVDVTTARKYGGTGLGLAISKLLVTAMGGTMSVESMVGKGSTFSFSITAPIIQNVTLPDYTVTHPNLLGRRALIVDDNETNRQSLTDQLGTWGMQLTIAESETTALELLSRGATFDLAILDMHMHAMHGTALIDAIRKKHPAYSLPIILLTTLGATSPQPEDVCTTLLSKPVKTSRLYRHTIRLLSTPAYLRQQASLASHQQGSSAHNEMAQRIPLRILLAEDNEINQQLIIRMLSRLGYQANVVPNGQAAVYALQRQSYDLILMDVQMPEMDGLEATRIIRSTYPPEQQPWIIAVTAGAILGDREVCLSAGMNDFVTKPIEQRVLIDALERYRSPEIPQAQQADMTRSQEAPAVTADMALDRDALQQLANTLGDQGDTMLKSLITTFIESAHTLQASARQALQRKDSQTLRRTMHTLKSNASTFGAKPLATLCRDLDHRAAEGKLDGTEALLDRVEAEFSRVRTALDAF